jgi:hypothetical protein
MAYWVGGTVVEQVLPMRNAECWQICWRGQTDRQLSQWPKVGLVACHVIMFLAFFSLAQGLV